MLAPSRYQARCSGVTLRSYSRVYRWKPRWQPPHARRRREVRTSRLDPSRRPVAGPVPERSDAKVAVPVEADVVGAGRVALYLAGAPVARATGVAVADVVLPVRRVERGPRGTVEVVA